MVRAKETIPYEKTKRNKIFVLRNPSLSVKRRVYDTEIRTLLILSAALCCALLLFLIGYIFYRGLPNVSWEFLTSEESFLKGTIGIFPNICNTLYLIFYKGGHTNDREITRKEHYSSDYLPNSCNKCSSLTHQIL